MPDILWIVKKMVCGSIFLELLENKHGIKLNEDGQRRLYIGLLGETKNDENSPNGLKNNKGKKQNKNLDPFIIGYYLSQHLEKIIQSEDGEVSISVDYAAALWQKYQLDIPQFRPFFPPPIDDSHFSYTRIYNTIASNLEQLQELSSTDYNNEVLIDAESFAEKCAMEYYQSSGFSKEKSKKIKPAYLMPQIKKQQKNMEDVSKWAADEKKKKYYVYRWRSICKKAFPSNILSNNSNEEMQRNCQLFFDALMTEINDVDTESKRKKEARARSLKVMRRLTLAIAFVNAVNILIVSYDDNIWFKLASQILTFISTGITGWRVFCEAKEKDDSNEETWLRHKLNYYRLTSELEMFFAGKSAYKAVWEQDQNAIRQCIILFMNRINEWRILDYRYFFTNMNSDINEGIDLPAQTQPDGKEIQTAVAFDQDQHDSEGTEAIVQSNQD